eukprot:TRINITY_DN560_c0_g1_i1.p2 TRINITY_DN560_c0_g1~~TRINITY_DN560_c0_g1_i1.p2  ORF type:complete len:134 (-),score=20.83 TRINITY_DN560_c0_g1_i1:392-793(-)
MEFANSASEIVQLLQKTQQTTHKIATAPKVIDDSREEYSITGIGAVERILSRPVPMKVISSMTHDAISASMEEKQLDHNATCDTVDWDCVKSLNDLCAVRMINAMKEHVKRSAKRKWQVDVTSRRVIRKKKDT